MHGALLGGVRGGDGVRSLTSGEGVCAGGNKSQGSKASQCLKGPGKSFINSSLGASERECEGVLRCWC